MIVVTQAPASKSPCIEHHSCSSSCWSRLPLTGNTLSHQRCSPDDCEGDGHAPIQSIVRVHGGADPCTSSDRASGVALARKLQRTGKLAASVPVASSADMPTCKQRLVSMTQDALAAAVPGGLFSSGRLNPAHQLPATPCHRLAAFVCNVTQQGAEQDLTRLRVDSRRTMSSGVCVRFRA